MSTILRMLLAVLVILVWASAAPAAELLYSVENPTPAAGDGFGRPLAISGNYLVVGAAGDDTLATNAGAAYLFDFGPATTNLLRTLDNPNPANPSAFADDNFGGSVAVSGNYVVVGASGEDIGATIQQAAVGMAYVFNAATGTVVQTLTNPTPLFGEGFGSSVAVSGTKAVIGTPWPNTNAANAIGSAYLFDVTTGALLRTFGSPVPAANDRFGGAVAIDGNYVIIGAPSTGSTGSGPGFVYVFDATTGDLLHTISNPGLLDPTAKDRFGASLAVSGTRLLVGAPNVDRTDVGNSVRVGAAYLFDFTTGGLLHTWDNPDPRDEIGFPSSGESFGGSVALNGNKVLIGTPGDDNGRGAAYLFDATTGGQVDTYYDPTPLGFEGFAGSVAVSDSMVMAGPSDAGVRVFEATVPTLVGDYNNDGTVDAADYVAWRKSVGTEDGYNVWQAHFGQTASGAALPFAEPLSAATPEPASLALAGIGLAAIGVLGFRRGCRAAIGGNLSVLFAVLAILAVSPAAPAAVLFTETFSYPDGHLASAPPAGGVSGGLWSVHEAGVEHLRVDVSSGKITLFQNSRTICSTCVTSHGQDVHRNFSTLSAGQTAFAGFDVSAMGNDDPVYFAEFMGGPTKLFVTPFAGSNFTFGIGNESASSVPTVNWPSGLMFDTTYRVVVSYEFDTGNSRLWVNPTNEASSNIQAAGSPSVPVSALAMRQYWIGTVVVPSRQVIDNIVVGTTFDDVLVIPGPVLPGDFNGDSSVDAADYVVWRKNDDTQDAYDNWRENFGDTLSGSGSGASVNAVVPEPSALILLMFTAAGWYLRRGHSV